MTDHIEKFLAELLTLMGRNSEQMTHMVEALNAQNSAIAEQNEALRHVPSKKDVFNANLAVLLFVLILISVSTGLQLKATIDSRNIAAVNNTTVALYCGADQSLAECTNPGSVTSKASAILANCRIWNNLKQSGFVSKDIQFASDKGCAALGFAQEDRNVR